MATWTNANHSFSWNDAKNWDTHIVPQDGDDVTIPAADAEGNTGVSGPTGAPPITLSALTLQGLELYGGPFTVTGTLTWTGGEADADMTVTGTATITGLDGSAANPGMTNQHTLTVTGAMNIIGAASDGPAPKFLLTAGSQLINTGTLSLSGAGFGNRAGAPGIVNDSGSMNVSGNCHSSGGVEITHQRGARLIIASGGEFVVGADAALQLTGGTVSGDGTLQVGDGGSGGEIDVVADTTVPNLVIGVNGAVAPGAGAGMPSPVLPGILTVQQTLEWGHGAAGSQYSTLLGHLILAAGATAVIDGRCFIDDGKFENAGHMTVAPNAVLEIDGDLPIFLNTGTITISALATITRGSLINTGLIQNTGSGAAVLDTALTNRGNVAVNQGTLQIGDYDWTIAGGMVTMQGGSLDGPGLGWLMLAGGTEGGVLTGAGTVTATVVNGGWVEPATPGLTITEYAQQPEGNIALPSAAATAKKPLLTLGGKNLHLDGSLWLLA